ncbi:FecR family protein [Sphingobacterium hotanense]|uniref:FecR domain-containing protein n=1 Tax=Sphingobacterium hotanense TaxID=649196 RepID=A0ABT7NL00_9SPHI|nr:FecR family protein [Sphingobacterium hotanense]MDM1047821.1 FecR domain-containing protein [Sphingobacterium hotanense]
MINLFQKNQDRKKKQQLWRGIVMRAQQDADESLNHLLPDSESNSSQARWMVAAVIACVLSVLGLWFFNESSYLKESELKSVFADTASISKLVLANGDTILLDNLETVSVDLGEIMSENGQLDFRKWKPGNPLGNEQWLETGRGRQQRVILADGTAVWLNASSKITFPAGFQGHTREVSVQGEVYFEVAPDQEKPFIVHTPQQQVRVLGTHFNTRDYSNEQISSVTLLEGSVSINKGQKEVAHLSPSDQFVIDKAHGTQYTKVLQNATAVVAWKDGDFYFEDASPEMIVNELERWYPVKIKLKEIDKTKKISGRIKRKGSMQEVVDMLHFFDIDLLIQKQE